MDRKASIELLRKMLEIYSPSGKEAELAIFLEKELEKIGFERVWMDKVGNIYGEVGCGTPTVLLCGHMDTVSGWIPVKTGDGRLYGRGAVDAKASLAAIISAASSLEMKARKGRVIVAGVVEEESKAKGIRRLIREGLNVDYAVFGEPSGIKNITFAYKGKLGLKTTCKTVPGHVGAQHLLDNAIEKSFELWSQLKTFCEQYKSPHGAFYSLTPCLTRISSRRTSGGVPDVCMMNIDLRLPPTIKSEKGTALAKSVVDGFQTANQGVSVSLKVIDSVEPFVASRKTIVMKALKEATSEVTEESVKFIRKTGTGDMNIFGAETGVPVATYGPGDAGLSHTPNEYIDLSEYLTSIEVYKKTIENIFT
jgi:LysW-gamma-L-lysine carboxypeptidase